MLVPIASDIVHQSGQCRATPLVSLYVSTISTLMLTYSEIDEALLLLVESLAQAPQLDAIALLGRSLSSPVIHALAQIIPRIPRLNRISLPGWIVLLLLGMYQKAYISPYLQHMAWVKRKPTWSLEAWPNSSRLISIWFKHRQSLSHSLATFDFTNGYANCPAERGYS